MTTTSELTEVLDRDGRFWTQDAVNDEHGWSGMEAVVKTATAVAEAAGLDIHTEGVPNV